MIITEDDGVKAYSPDGAVADRRNRKSRVSTPRAIVLTAVEVPVRPAATLLLPCTWREQSATLPKRSSQCPAYFFSFFFLHITCLGGSSNCSVEAL